MLIFRREAEAEIRNAYEWYESKVRNLGLSFMAEVEAALAKIEERPKAHRIVIDEVRRALCKKFPYAIYFPQQGSMTVVLAVLHKRRSPETWKNRGRM